MLNSFKVSTNIAHLAQIGDRYHKHSGIGIGTEHLFVIGGILRNKNQCVFTWKSFYGEVS